MMEDPRRKSGRVGLSAMICLLLLLQTVCSQETHNILKNTKPVTKIMSPAVQLSSSHHEQVIIDNGIIEVTFSSPQGLITGIKYNGIDNVLDKEIEDRGYWDVYWYEPDQPSQIDKMEGTDFRIITQDEEQVEISFSRTWNISDRAHKAPINVDKRYIICTGSSGIYMYAVLERLEEWPDVDMDQIRIVFKLNPKLFDYMAITDRRRRNMPSESDRSIDGGRAQALAFKEAVLLTNPKNPAFRGEVDDKYQYSTEDKDNKVHGWISSGPRVGFWMISPSDEYRVGGPIKQDLTSHVGPITLAMFTSTHYAGKDMDMEYRNGEPWKKVFGPVFLYLNSDQDTEDDENIQLKLWKDAQKQMAMEVGIWPYEFVASEDFPKKHQRGTITGQLQVKDRYVSRSVIWGKYAYVGLAPPGEVGSWQTEAKGYQFWTRADRRGYFKIDKIRPGNYSLYAWVPGFIGDYKYDPDITITPDCEINLGALVYEPPRSGPTLWEIGKPDRTAREFFIPDPYPTLMNRLYANQNKDKFRQYGLWDRYADLYPKHDLVYTVGVSDYRREWFFAQVTRNVGNNTYESTTWQIVFNLERINPTANYTLRLALASATESELQVRINEPSSEPGSEPLFTTGYIGKDNAIARHGIHGLYRLYHADVIGSLLKAGDNIVFLTQVRSRTPFQGVMYDYIRLEGPDSLQLFNKKT